ncbi:MAG: MerR family transcriptional regulator [Candidatus Pacearchaeota archaeon]
MADIQKIFYIREVAEQLSVTPQTIYYYVKNGFVDCEVYQRKKYKRYFLTEAGIKQLKNFIKKRMEIKN